MNTPIHRNAVQPSQPSEWPLIVFGAASFGCGVTWVATKVWARWER